MNSTPTTPGDPDIVEEVTTPEELRARLSPDNLDRRRRGTGSHALILLAAEALPPLDRALIRAVYADGRTAAEIAALKGLKPRAVAYRVRLLTERVLSPQYTFVREHRRAWGRSRAKVATCCFIHGRSIREAARLARISFHAARQHHAAVLALAAASHAPSPRPRAPGISDQHTGASWQATGGAA